MGAVIAARHSVARNASARGSVVAFAPRNRHAITSSDELFFSLEGRTVEAGGQCWQLEVCGVHSGSSQHWIQLQLRGPVLKGLTIRVPRLDTRRVLTIVCNWLEGSLPSDLERSVTGQTYLPVLT